MANRYFLNDGGDVCFFENQVWTKVGTSMSNVPDASSPAVLNIAASGPMTYADAQSRNNYTAEEMGVGANKYPIASVAMNAYAWTTIVASVPVSGVFRGWDANERPETQWRVNGIVVAGGSGLNGSFIRSVPLNVAIGDHIEVYNGWHMSTTGYGFLIPFAYTNPG